MKVFDSIRRRRPVKVMPPPAAGGKGSRSGGAATRCWTLAKLKVWFDKGKPSGVFDMAVRRLFRARAGGVEGAGSYLVSEELSEPAHQPRQLRARPGDVRERDRRMDELDALFAAATELPENLAETDLVSLDSAVLAQRGVIAFVPTYPLWSDGLGQDARGARAPGHIDPVRQAPPRVRHPAEHPLLQDVPQEGRRRQTATSATARSRPASSWPARTRPGRTGRYQATALFGTYAWNEDETEARLVQDPLRNGQPFKDRLITYVADEPLAAKVRQTARSKQPRTRPTRSTTRTRASSAATPSPGNQRCIECHMGSPSADFVLGFTPLQIKRRRAGEGGDLRGRRAPTSSPSCSGSSTRR